MVTLFPSASQIFADVSGCRIETVENPQNVEAIAKNKTYGPNMKARREPCNLENRKS